MKKVFTLLAAMLLAVMIYAYPNQSMISISNNSKTAIRLMVDGNRYRASNNAVLINNLNAGYHSIKVYQLKKNYGGVRSGSVNNNYQLVYNVNVYVKPQYYVDIIIIRFGKAFFDEQPIAAGYYGDDDEDDWGDNNSNYNGNNNHNYNSNRLMNMQSFDHFIESLGNESFDNTRMNIAKQVISTNRFTTAQVKEIMGFFSFENSKLDIAKYALKYTVNKGNYFTLADEFSFSSNKDELIRYIQANK